MKTNWDELRVLLKSRFKFTFYNNKTKWGRTIKISIGKDSREDELIWFMNGFNASNVHVRKHSVGPWSYVMLDIED